MDNFDFINNLYGFAFPGVPAKVMYRLKTLDLSNTLNANNIDQYMQMLIHDQPKYILGMGIYTGIDQDKIRIETVAKNLFRNDAIDIDLQKSETILFPSFLSERGKTKYATALGNSWCNLISWRIGQLIHKGELKSKYSFLHIPTTFNLNDAIAVVEELLISSDIG